jgi:hypothetical protein
LQAVQATKKMNRKSMPHSIPHNDARLALFNKKWASPWR